MPLVVSTLSVRETLELARNALAAFVLPDSTYVREVVNPSEKQPAGAMLGGAELELSRGTMNAVVRSGGWVLRPAGEHTDFVQDLLGRLARAGCGWAPRPGGRTADGRERVSFLPGLADWQLRGRGGDPFDLRALLTAMRWVRSLHDATLDPVAGFVTCHGDLGPHNLLYTVDGGAAGLIDFDLAHRGRRVDDLATAVKELARFGDPGPDAPRVHDAVALLAAYGWDAVDLGALLDRVPRAYDDDLKFCTAQADAGNDYYRRWACSGGPADMGRKAALAHERLAALEALAAVRQACHLRTPRRRVPAGGAPHPTGHVFTAPMHGGQ